MATRTLAKTTWRAGMPEAVPLPRPAPARRAPQPARARTLRDVVELGVLLCRLDTPVHSLADQMLTQGVEAAVVVDDELVPRGAISVRRLGRRHALRPTRVVASQIMEPVALLPASTPLGQASDIARYLRVPYFVVTVREGDLRAAAVRGRQVVPAGLVARAELVRLAQRAS